MAGMGDALQEALQGGIADKLDKEILQGTEGLLTGSKLANHARGAASDYSSYVADLLYGRVDGKYAYDLADIRVVMGSDTFGNAATKLPSEWRSKTRWPGSATIPSGVRVSRPTSRTASEQQAERALSVSALGVTWLRLCGAR